MSHKILIELEPEVEAYLRKVAEEEHTSMSEIAGGAVNRMIKELLFYRSRIPHIIKEQK